MAVAGALYFGQSLMKLVNSTKGENGDNSVTCGQISRERDK